MFYRTKNNTKILVQHARYDIYNNKGLFFCQYNIFINFVNSCLICRVAQKELLANFTECIS